MKSDFEPNFDIFDEPKEKSINDKLKDFLFMYDTMENRVILIMILIILIFVLLLKYYLNFKI